MARVAGLAPSFAALPRALLPVAHHGTLLHVHTVLGAGAGPVVHVDDARLAAGAVLRTPWPRSTEDK